MGCFPNWAAFPFFVGPNITSGLPIARGVSRHFVLGAEGSMLCPWSRRTKFHYMGEHLGWGFCLLVVIGGESMGEHLVVYVDEAAENEGMCEDDPLIQTAECRICQEEDEIQNFEVPCACNGSLKILAMRHPRRLVLTGCLSALIVMTILSAVVGWAAPNLDEDWKTNAADPKDKSKDDETLKKQRRSYLAQFFSPILLKAFSITFFGEWGDKSQLATIGLAADENPFGVVLGGILGQALCTTAAVVGGKSLASQISEKMVALSGGILFIIFGIQSMLSTVG